MNRDDVAFDTPTTAWMASVLFWFWFWFLESRNDRMQKNKIMNMRSLYSFGLVARTAGRWFVAQESQRFSLLVRYHVRTEMCEIANFKRLVGTRM